MNKLIIAGFCLAAFSTINIQAKINPHYNFNYNYEDMYGDDAVAHTQKETWIPTSDQRYIYNTKALDRSTNFQRIPKIPYTKKFILKPSNPNNQ